MEAVKENVKEKENVKPTVADCSMLGQAVNDLINSVPSMSGKLLMFFKNVQKKSDAIGKRITNQQNEILKKHIKMKGGNFVLTEPSKEELEQGAQAEYVYKSDDHRQKADAEMKKLWSSEVNTVFKQIHPTEFERLQIDPRKNPRIALIIEILIEEYDEEVVEAAEKLLGQKS